MHIIYINQYPNENLTSLSGRSPRCEKHLGLDMLVEEPGRIYAQQCLSQRCFEGPGVVAEERSRGARYRVDAADYRADIPRDRAREFVTGEFREVVRSKKRGLVPRFLGIGFRVTKSRPQELLDDLLSQRFPALLGTAPASIHQRQPSTVRLEERKFPKHLIAIHPVKGLTKRRHPERTGFQRDVLSPGVAPIDIPAPSQRGQAAPFGDHVRVRVHRKDFGDPMRQGDRYRARSASEVQSTYRRAEVIGCGNEVERRRRVRRPEAIIICRRSGKRRCIQRPGHSAAKARRARCGQERDCGRWRHIGRASGVRSYRAQCANRTCGSVDSVSEIPGAFRLGRTRFVIPARASGGRG